MGSYHQTNLSLHRKESHTSNFKFYSKFIGLSRHIVRSVLTWKMANISNSESAEEKPESGSEVSTEVGQTGEECKPTGSSGTLDEKANPGNNEDKGDKVEFKVIFNKKKYDVAFAEKATIGELKSHLQPLIGIPPAMMKVMIKGLAKDEMTLNKLGVVKGSKVMVIGSSLNDVLQVSSSPKEVSKAGSSSNSSKEEHGASKMKNHKKILDKGKPDDAMPARKSGKEPLPQQPLSGMLNKHGGKVRLTFKMDQGQVWIGTKERTEKVPLSSIKNVVSEPIDGHDDYHILALQLGPTEASRYYIYWVPAQYIGAISDAILGKWQYF